MPFQYVSRLLCTLSLLLIVCHLASALPYNQVGGDLPSTVTHMSFNGQNGEYRAYNRDGSLYGVYSYDPTLRLDEHMKRDPTSCAQLTIDEARRLPGFPKLEAYANAQWGTGKRNELTNDPLQPDSPAIACVSSDIAQVELSGSPVCTPINGVTDATASGTSGVIKSDVTQAYSNSGQWTVTSASSIGVSSTVSATLQLPGIGDIGSSVTTDATFTNTVTSGFTTTASTQLTNSAQFNVPTGQTCHITYDTNSCNVQGSGSVRYVASGWVWFEYISTVQGHYKWSVSIENVLTDLNDRSSVMSFTGSMKGTANANFTASCQ